MPALPDILLPIVDVRDAAYAHYLALIRDVGTTRIAIC